MELVNSGSWNVSIAVFNDILDRSQFQYPTVFGKDIGMHWGVRGRITCVVKCGDHEPRVSPLQRYSWQMAYHREHTASSFSVVTHCAFPLGCPNAIHNRKLNLAWQWHAGVSRHWSLMLNGCTMMAGNRLWHSGTWHRRRIWEFCRI